MARVTVEDCMSLVKNRFELCVLSAYRAKEISRGAPVTITKQEHDKNTVTSLREIADAQVSIEALRDLYMRSLHKNAYFDDVSEEDTQNISAELMDASESYVVETKNEDSEDSYIAVDDYGFEDEEDSDNK